MHDNNKTSPVTVGGKTVTGDTTGADTSLLYHNNSSSQDTYPLQSLSSLMDGPTTISWRVENVLPPKAVLILAGPAGVGKTWLTNDLAIDLSLGQSWLNHFQTEKGKVVIVDEENADLLLRVRFHMLLKAKGLKPEDIDVSFMVSKGVNFSPTTVNGNPQPTRAFYKLLRTMQAAQPSLIIFDSLTRCHRSDENSASAMSDVFDSVHKLVNETGASVILTHHLRKGNGTGSDMLRGSGDISAFADATLIVTPTNSGVSVTQLKARWGKDIDPFDVTFTATEDSFGLSYAGAAPKVNLRDAWLAVRDQLATGPMTRQQLIDFAEHEKLCSARTLDDILKWRAEKGYLNKGKLGKETTFSLTDKAQDAVVSVSEEVAEL